MDTVRYLTKSIEILLVFSNPLPPFSFFFVGFRKNSWFFFEFWEKKTQKN